MAPEGDSQLLWPERNGKELPQVSPLSLPSFPELEEENLDLRGLLTIFRRRAIIIAGVAIVVTAGAFIRVLKQDPIYEGRFRLLVEPVAEGNQFDKLTQK